MNKTKPLNEEITADIKKVMDEMMKLPKYKLLNTKNWGDIQSSLTNMYDNDTDGTFEAINLGKKLSTAKIL